MQSAWDIEVSVFSGDGYQIGIVDSTGSTVSSVRMGQECYIMVDAAGVDRSEFNVSIKAQSTNCMMITGDNRGRVYTHELEEHAARPTLDKLKKHEMKDIILFRTNFIYGIVFMVK